jgi:hypothetical protein
MEDMTQEEWAARARELNFDQGVMFGRSCIAQGLGFVNGHDQARLFAGPDMPDRESFLEGVTFAYGPQYARWAMGLESR